MSTILTIAQFQTFRDIGKRVDTDKLTEVLQLTEDGEMYDIFGELIFDMIKHAGGTDLGQEFTDLLDGSTYTVGSDEFTQPGVRAMMSDLAYARYMGVINENVTPFGITVKQDENSAPVDASKRRELGSQSRKDADSKFVKIKHFMCENTEAFKRYFDGKNPTLGQGKTIITII